MADDKATMDICRFKRFSLEWVKNKTHTSLRGTKQFPTYRATLYSIEIAWYLAMTRKKGGKRFMVK
jgi:hypothetical protein